MTDDKGMNDSLPLYRKIDSIGDIQSAAVVHFDDILDDLSPTILDAFGADLNIFQISSSEAESLWQSLPPISSLLPLLKAGQKKNASTSAGTSEAGDTKE